MVRVIDDAELLRLAAEPPRDAAPVLRRANWFAPLVALLIVAPAVIAVGRASLDEETACWGLRALSVRHAERLTEWLSPGTPWPDSPLQWSPPLQAWLTAPLLRWGPSGSSGPLFAVACVSLMVAIGMAYLFADETVGARWAVLSVLCLALHPQALVLVQTGGPDALCLALLAVTTWGLWGHLHGTPGVVSFRLLIAGLAWGLLLLAGGPLALAYLAVTLLWLAWSMAMGSAATPRPGRADLDPRAIVFTLGVLVATGGAIGSWWVAMMLAEHGLAFLAAWCVGSSGAASLPWHDVAPKTSWQDWLRHGVFLGGWCLVGVVSSARLGWSRRQSPEAQLARWLLVWATLGVGIRVALRMQEVHDPAALRLWETFALLPLTWLAALGLDRVLRRETAWQLVLLALMLLVGEVSWLATGRVSIGVIVGSAFGVLLMASAPLALGLRRSTLAWTETEIRRWVSAAALATIAGHAFLSWQVTRPAAERAVWRRVHRRLQTVEDISRASLIMSQHSDSPQLRYLMRSLWPDAAQSQSFGWDPLLTETLVREREQPRSRMVVVEWSRQDLRLQADVGSGWQVTPLVDPEPYRGRRLAVHLLAPAAR
jgi:hypothetical protein